MLLNIPTPVPKLGQVFTRRWVAETLLDLAGYIVSAPLENMRIVEPAVGEGAFLAPLLERLLDRALGRGVPLESLRDVVRAFDLDERKVESSRLLVCDALEMAGADPSLAFELAQIWITHGDYLLSHDDAPVDIVIGNPPYIRYDDMGPGQFALYQETWRTLAGRGDIYVGFWEKAMASLKPGGVAAFICADRWMRNSYGGKLRELVGERYSVRAVWSMHDVDAFEASVSAYPAITVIANEPQRHVAIAETTKAFGALSASQLAHWTLSGRSKGLTGDGFEAHKLAHWYRGSGLWPTGSPERLALLDQLDQLPTLEQAGVRVGIGLASGADGTYVVDGPVDIEQDRLLPMATRKSVTGTGLKWAGEYLVNPWDDDGLVPLARYPKLEKYLRSSERVMERHVAKANPTKWHRTIDRVIDGLAGQPKILIPDMRAQLQPYLDEQGLYPHHNFYWLTGDGWDLRVLGGLLLSDVAQSFIEAYCVRMRGGTLRLQAQYLRMIRVPMPETLSEDVKARLSNAFELRDRAEASTAAREAYGLGSPE